MKNAYAILLALIVMLGGMSHAQETPIIPEKTQEQADLERLDAGILSVAESLNHAAAVLTREHSAIWSLPDARLLSVLNANVARTIAISNAKDEAAAQINALLNKLNIPRYTNRAPLGFGRSDVIFNQETNLFEIVEPADPE